MDKTVEASVAVKYQGATWIGKWIKYKTYVGSDGKTAPDRYLVMSKIIDGGATPIHNLDLKYSELNVITGLITSRRVLDIQSALRLQENSDEIALTETILQRAWAGEWMGQTGSNHEFSVEDLAKILGKNFPLTWVLVSTLTEQRKAQLDGHLIKPWGEPN